MIFSLLPIFSLFFLCPSVLGITSVTTKGVIMMQILIDQPGRPFCISEDLTGDNHISSFAYVVSKANHDIPIDLTLYDDSPRMIKSEGPAVKVVELDTKPNRTGLHTLCVKTSAEGGRPHIAVMLGMFILTASGNETDENGGLEPVKLDDSFGVLQIENLAHIATRVMLAISNAQHSVRQSALYMIHDTTQVESILSTVTKWSLAVSIALMLAAAVQVNVLKSFFEKKTRVSA